MKKILFLAPLFLMACTVSQKIAYKTDDVTASESANTIPIKVDVRVLEDNRMNIEDNSVLFDNPREIKLNGKRTCINSEKHYAKDTVVTQVTRLMVDHFNQARLFEEAFYNQDNSSDYYLTGTLNSFYGDQKYSTGAAIGAGFGLIGALATSGAKTPGKIIIELADLKLFKKDGTFVKDFGTFYKEYEDEFKADAACWCIYWNINEKLKDFNTQLVEKIRNDLSSGGVNLSQK